MKSVLSVAAAATFAVMASTGLARSAPQPVRRGDLDLSSPYIPPARPKLTSDEKAAIRDLMIRAAEKRHRKSLKLKALAYKGAIASA